MLLDALKTCHIEGLPNIPYQEISKALQIVGPNTVFKIPSSEHESSCSAFCQFRTAAQVKVALEILPQVRIQRNSEGEKMALEVSSSMETKEWIENVAAAASAQSLTRMQPAALVIKLESQFEASIRQRSRAGEGQINTLEPDGTLGGAEFAPAELESLLKDTLQFRKDTLRLQTEQESQRAELIERFRDKIKFESESIENADDAENADYAAFDETKANLDSRLTWEQAVVKVQGMLQELTKEQKKAAKEEQDRQERAKKELEKLKDDLVYSGEIRELQLRCSQEREADELDVIMENEQGDIEQGDIEHEDQPAAQKEIRESPTKDAVLPITLSLNKEVDWTRITPDWIESTLKPWAVNEVENIFGEADESVVQFIVELVQDQTASEALVCELEGPLDDEATQVAEKLLDLLKSA